LNDAWRRVAPFRNADAPVIRYLTIDEITRLLNASQNGIYRKLHSGLGSVRLNENTYDLREIQTSLFQCGAFFILLEMGTGFMNVRDIGGSLFHLLRGG